jgi:hypothetical protein
MVVCIHKSKSSSRQSRDAARHGLINHFLGSIVPRVTHHPPAPSPVSFRLTMNTISPPPQVKRLSGPKRILGILVGITGGLGANALLAYSVSSFYTRNTKFVPFDTSAPDLTTKTFRNHNPLNNPPACIDHAIKQIPYGKLPEKYWVKGSGGRISVDQKALTTDFCRSIWSGVGFRVQRRILERKYRALEGREDHLWDVKDLEKSSYQVGTKIVDHFEVVEHTDDKVCFCDFVEIRCNYAC